MYWLYFLRLNSSRSPLVRGWRLLINSVPLRKSDLELGQVKPVGGRSQKHQIWNFRKGGREAGQRWGFRDSQLLLSVCGVNLLVPLLLFFPCSPQYSNSSPQLDSTGVRELFKGKSKDLIKSRNPENRMNRNETLSATLRRSQQNSTSLWKALAPR